MSRHIESCSQKIGIPSSQVSDIIPDSTPPPSELSTIIQKISWLQMQRKFPKCALNNLTILDADQSEFSWEEPALLLPSEVWAWEKPVSSEEIFRAVHILSLNLPAQHVLHGGEFVSNKDKDITVSNAFYQAFTSLDDSDASPKSTLMNIPLGSKFHRMQPSPTMKHQLQIVCEKDIDLLANFAPAGSFVDIHIDHNRHGLSQSTGNSERIWLLYPPTDGNLKLFVPLLGESGRLTKISSQLTGGYIACVDSTKVVYIPPGWLHSTFTTKSGCLVGINFESLEALQIMAKSVAIHLPSLHRTPNEFLDDFDHYTEAICYTTSNSV
ncbi:hypothetical protein FQN50_010006 [Emmonsiellopsis sp. PD_5]|nr:hypothetical protein FQN50_010006 [Emmonsiellopsis sp. PD_5]